MKEKAMSLLKEILTRPKAKVLLLGSIHFGDEILSDSKQAEIREIVDSLSEFQPTKIAVEDKTATQEELDRNYKAYLSGEWQLPRNEGYQIGFPIAARLRHGKVYAVDEWGITCTEDQWRPVLDHVKSIHSYTAEPSDEELFTDMYEPVWKEYMEKLNACHEQLSKGTLKEYLSVINSEEFLKVSHGGYLMWLKGKAGDYALADHMTDWWFNRNLRIFSNLRNISDSADDRILLIIGVDHIPIIRHCIENSPEFEPVKTESYL
jgi:hypothetical protein